MKKKEVSFVKAINKEHTTLKLYIPKEVVEALGLSKGDYIHVKIRLLKKVGE